MVRFAVCDDDARYLRSITQIICDSYEASKTIDEDCECILYNSGEELIDHFIEDEIDIFFLDIECGDMSGFDIAKELLKRKKNLEIVYVTNHQHYIYDAFVCRPLGFIRKGCIEEDIKMPMVNIVDFLKEKKRTIVFEGNKGALKLYISDIVAVEVFDHELRVVLQDRKFDCKGSLSTYEKLLEKNGFMKISRAILVNKKYITRIAADQVCLCENIEYTISRRRIHKVRENWKG